MERSMEAIVACCAGLDVHQAGVVACLNRGGKRGGKEIRSFGTTRGELAEKSRRLRARRGEMRAHVAIAHKILIAAYHVLAGAEYQELGADYLDGLNKKRTVSHLTRRLQAMGYDVQITPKAA